MNLFLSIVNIIALLVIPIISVCVGNYLQNKSKKREEKMNVFKILMASRIHGWSFDMVNALNIIEIVFSDDEDVIKQWRTYFDLLCVEDNSANAIKKREDAKNKMLETMAKSLGYKNISWEIIQNPYMPKGMVDELIASSSFKHAQQDFIDTLQKSINS